MAESNSSQNTSLSRLFNNVLLPVLTPSGEVSLKQLRNTILGHLSQSLGLTTPAIIKCLKIDPQGNNAEDSLCYESYRERCWHLLQQLTPLTPDSPLQVFGCPLTNTYLPLLIRGASKNQVLYLASPIADYLKSLFSTPEELLAYGKCIVNEPAYGLYELTVNISIQPDTNDELYQDGIGYISPNLLQLMNVGEVIQMRAVISPEVSQSPSNTSPLSQLSHPQPLHVSQPSIAKGLLKSNPNLPQNSIVFTSSQFKGKKSDWTGEKKLLLVVMANIDKPRKVKDSWTSLEINRDIRDNNVHLLHASEKARSYCKIITSAISYGEYTKLFEESTCDHSKNIESEDLSSSPVHHSMLQYAVKIASGSTNPNLPPLEQHPYLALGMRDLLASKLRELAVDGPVRWNYLINTGTLLKDHPRSIHTNLYPIGTHLVCRRYPILLSDSWGIVTAPSDTNQEIRLGTLIAQELSTDHDGDMIGLLECPLRLKATQKARQ